MKAQVLAVLSLLLLSGCTGSDGADPAPGGLALGETGASTALENETANVTLPMTPPILYGGGCTTDALVLLAPASSIAQGLPPGFTPAQFVGSLNGGPAPSNLGQAIVGIVACENETYNGTEYEAPRTVVEFVVVNPPAEMRDDNNTTLYFLGKMGAPDEPRAAIFREWGIGDTATFSMTVTETPAARVAQMAGALAGLSFQGTSETAANTGILGDQVFGGAPQGEATYRFFIVDSGAVTGWADLTFGASTEWFGSATATLTGGTGGFAHPALAGVSIYRFGMEFVRTRYAPYEPVV